MSSMAVMCARVTGYIYIYIYMSAARSCVSGCDVAGIQDGKG